MADSLNDANKSHRSAKDISKLESAINTGVKSHQAQADAFKSGGRSTPQGKSSGATNKATPDSKSNDNASDVTKSESSQKAGYVARSKSGASNAHNQK